MSKPQYQPRSDTSARLLGFGFLSAGIALIYWQGYLPLLGATEHRPLIEYSVKLIVLGIFLVCFGLFCVIRGLAGYTYVAEIKGRPRAMKVLVGISLVVALGLWGVIDHVFGTYGYNG